MREEVEEFGCFAAVGDEEEGVVLDGGNHVSKKEMVFL